MKKKKAKYWSSYFLSFFYFCMLKYERAKFFLDQLTSLRKRRKKKKKMQSARTHLPIYNESY
jgi:hypothetical protein